MSAHRDKLKNTAAYDHTARIDLKSPDSPFTPGLLPHFLPKPFDSSDVCRLRTGVERRHKSPAGGRRAARRPTCFGFPEAVLALEIQVLHLESLLSQAKRDSGHPRA